LTGAVAGATSAVAFAAVHALVISDIWFFVVPMVVAGVVSGLCLAATFGVLVRAPTVRTWLLYNATFVALFVLLGVVSLAIYEPVTTIAALIAMGQPPEWLFRDTLPLSVAFVVASAAIVAALFGHRWWHVAPALVTMTPLTLFLGLNISVLGMVDVPRSSRYLFALNFGLICALVVVYAAIFVALEWRALHDRPAA
jgi:hypothetical protein